MPSTFHRLIPMILALALLVSLMACRQEEPADTTPSRNTVPSASSTGGITESATQTTAPTDTVPSPTLSTVQTESSPSVPEPTAPAVTVPVTTVPTTQPTTPTTKPTEPPTQPTEPPTQPTEPTTQPTTPPTLPTEPPTQPTEPPTQPTKPPTQPTEPPTQPTEPPTLPTEPPTQPTEPPTLPTEPPTQPTEPPTQPTEPPTQPTKPPTQPTEPPTQPTEPPTQPTKPPTQPTKPPTQPTEPPTEPTEPPTEPEPSLPSDGYEETNTLSNPNATVEAQKLYDYLCSLPGVNTLSGQQESTWMGSPDYEINYIFEKTGKYPAIRGLDYMHDDFDGVNRRAIEWWNKGGIVTIMWHTGSDFSGEWADAMNDVIADWDAVLTEGTPEHAAFLAGMDKGAKALLELQEAGVPVIWRPFHEFDGQWFWWGKGGSDNFIKLWQLMYDRYTNYWGLNNLIWVLPYSGNGRSYSSWYPGDEYCDIVGADSYNGGVQNRLYKLVDAVCSTKPHCFHECGTNPTAAQLQTTHWIWFMTWHTSYLTDSNEPAALNALYNSEYVLTLDELPSFR